MKTRILATILCLLMVISLIPASVFAAGAEISVGTATGKPGEEITVPVEISNNPGFAGFTVTIEAAEGLTLKQIKKGSLLAEAEGMFTANVAKNSINWTASANVEGDGELMLLTFDIAAEAADGDYAISVALKDGKESNFANADETAVEVSFVEGAVKVSTEEPTEEPTEAPTEPTEAPTEPTEAPTEPTEEPTEAPTEPTEAPTEPTEAPTEPTEAPTEPTTEPTECDGGENCPSKAFKDVKAGDWYHEAVDFAVSKGLFNGMSPTTFEPNTAMSRAMLVTVLWRYEGSVEEGKNTFTDVPDGQWYTKAVAWAAKNGIVDGIGDKKFDPNGNITREQMAAILYRYAKQKGFDTSKTDDLKNFPDADKVSEWAKEAVSWIVAEGIITGNEGKLDPQGNATRAQVATILMRYINKFA